MSIATGYFNDDEEPVISFSDAEKRHLPGSDRELRILVQAARQCYRILDPRQPGTSQEDCWTNYVRSNHCAFQLRQRQATFTSEQLASIAVKVKLPRGEETLPILLRAYDACLASWTDIAVDCLLGAHIILDDIGDKLYPDSFKREVYQQLGDIADAL